MNKTVEMLLKGNAIAASLSLIGSVFVGASSVSLLFAASPFIPDQQEHILKEFLPATLILCP
jgi:hypothetical protein